MDNDKKYTREGDKRFTLRIEQNLFQQLEASARASKRSIGRQIEYIIDKFLNSGKKAEETDIFTDLDLPPMPKEPENENKKRA